MKKNVVNSYNGILYGNENKQSTATGNVDESHKNRAERKKRHERTHTL